MASSHFDDFVRQGFVEIKSKRFGTWKKRSIVLRAYSSVGPNRIEEFTEQQAFHRLNNPSSTHPIRVWPLIKVAGVTQGNSRPNPRKRKVTVYFENSVDQLKFRTSSAQEAEQWRLHIDAVSSMVYADIRTSDDIAPGYPAVVQTACFRVFLHSSPRLSFSGECHMEVTSRHVIITDHLHNGRSVTWDIDTIRRFGSDDRQLTIETGRSSRTGEGNFEFRSFEAQEIERHLNSVTSALSTAVHVMETDVVNRGGAPAVPSRPSQHQMQRQQRQQYYQRNQSTEADGWYMRHARSEPGSSDGIYTCPDSPEAYRRPSAPNPYPRTTGKHSPPAVTNRPDVFPMYFAGPVVGARRPSTPVFFENQNHPLSSAPPYPQEDFLSQDDDSSDDFECPPVLPPERSHRRSSRRRRLASSGDILFSQDQKLTPYLEYPRVLPPERPYNRQPASCSRPNPFQSQQQQQQQQQQHQQDRLPDVTSIPTRTAFISTSSCPSPSSPSHTHSSRRKFPSLPPPSPPPQSRSPNIRLPPFPPKSPQNLPPSPPPRSPRNLPPYPPSGAPSDLPPSPPPKAPSDLPPSPPPKAPSDLPPSPPPRAPRNLPSSSPPRSPRDLPIPPRSPNEIPPSPPPPLPPRLAICFPPPLSDSSDV